MPIRQRDAEQNIVSIKTLNDITAGSPLPVSIPGTLTSTDTIVQGRIGGTNSTPAPLPTTDTGLNGVIKGLWKDLADRFLSLVGTTADAPSSTGSLMARLRQIAENAGTGSSGGGSVSGSVAIQDGTTSANKLAVNASGQIGVSNFPATQAVSSTDLGVQADVAATADTGSFTLIAAIKRFLARFTTYLTIVGTTADVADTTGTLMARIRATLDRVGSYGDAAIPTGSIMAQLRYVGESLNRTTIVTPINESLSGDRTILGAVAGKSIRITSLYYTVDQQVNVTLKSGTTAISGAMPILDHAGDYPQPLPLATGEAFVINLSAAANLRGYVIWYLV